MSDSDQDTPLSLVSYAVDLSTNTANKTVAETAEITQSKPNEIIASKSILKKPVEIAADSKAAPKAYKSVNAVHNPPSQPRVARTAAKPQLQPTAQSGTQPPAQPQAVGAVARVPSRERLPKKTVAFGLTTNLDETVEKLQNRLSVLRPPSFCGVSMKNTEEVQKALKAYADEVSALRADKEELRKTNEELREGLSSLRAIVMEISLRVMRLEDGATADKSPPAQLDGSADAGDSWPAPRTGRASPKGSPLPQPARNQRSLVIAPTANASGRRAIEAVSLPSATAVAESTLTAVGSSHMGELRRIPPLSQAGRSEVSQVLAVIENRLRETPEILSEVWKLIERSKKPVRGVSSRKIADTRPLNDSLPPTTNQTGSPYSARYTQKMTVERTYSIQADVPRENFDPYVRRAYAPPNSNGCSRRPTVAYRDSTAEDAQFFEEDHGYQHPSEDRFFRDTAGNDDQENDEHYGEISGLNNRTATRHETTFGGQRAPTGDVRERYRRRKC